MQVQNVYRIPFDVNARWFAQTVELQGVTYVLEFQYNAREQRWFMDILDVGETPLVRGICLTINRDLNGQYGSYVLPKGTFFCRDSSGAGREPTFTSFALDHVLLFLDQTPVDA